MPPCLTLSITRYGSRVKWSNPGKGVAPSPTPCVVAIEKKALVTNFTFQFPLDHLPHSIKQSLVIFFFLQYSWFTVSSLSRHNPRQLFFCYLSIFSLLSLFIYLFICFSGKYFTDILSQMKLEAKQVTQFLLSLFDFTFSCSSEYIITHRFLILVPCN